MQTSLKLIYFTFKKYWSSSEELLIRRRTELQELGYLSAGGWAKHRLNHLCCRNNWNCSFYAARLASTVGVVF